MNVASSELSKELYNLTGWANDLFYSEEYEDYDIPAYDLGYLMRILPSMAYVQVALEGYVAAVQETELVHKYPCFGDTPENAACKLTIELFNQGFLIRDAHQGRMEKS